MPLKHLALPAVLVLVVLALAVSPVRGEANATTRYVDGLSGSDSGDCVDGAPCQTIKYALSQASTGDTILIACGLYVENVSLVRSMNLMQDPASVCPDGISATTISASSTSILVKRPLTVWNKSTVSVTGVIIENGDLVPDNLAGGGVFVEALSTLTLTNVVVRNNKAVDGGGIYSGGTLYLIDSEVYGNAATDDGGGIYAGGRLELSGSDVHDNRAAARGGGIFAVDAEVHALEGSVVSRNHAGAPTDRQVSDNGGGIYAENTDLTVADCEISRNRAAYRGGGIYVEQGATLSVSDVTFNGNTAHDGGGLFNFESGATLTNVTFSGNTVVYGGGGMSNNSSSATLTNVIFSGNTAPVGGGMANAYVNSATLTNVTFSGNTATVGGGMSNFESSLLIQNTILWSNSAASSGPSIHNDASSPTIRFSLVEGDIGTGSIDGGDNLTGDPLFVRAVACGTDGCGDDPDTLADESANDDYGDLRLQGTSPAIDVGDNAADLDGLAGGETISDVAQDLDGNPRIAAVTVFVAIVDLGAYERPNAAPTFTSNPQTNATEESAYSYTATTEDNTPGIRPITAQQKPAWLNFTDNGDGTAILNGTPQNQHVGDHSVVLRAQDALGASGYQTFTLTVFNTNDPPSFTSIPPTAVTAGQAYNYAVATSDPDVGDTRTLTALVKPGWLTFTDNGDGTATLSGTPTTGGVGVDDVVLQVEDAGTLSDEQVFSITIKPATTGSLAGQVLAEGEGVADVTVTLNDAAAATVAGPTAVIDQDVTNTQGTYSFDGLTPGPYTLTFDPPDGFETPTPVGVTVVASQVTDVPSVALTPSDSGGDDSENRLYLPRVIQ